MVMENNGARERMKEFALNKERSVMEFERKTGIGRSYIACISKSVMADKGKLIKAVYPDFDLQYINTGVKAESATESESDKAVKDLLKEIRRTNAYLKEIAGYFAELRTAQKGEK